MKRLLLLLLASISLPACANASSTWLILKYQNGRYLDGAVALQKIEMKNQAQCELEGAKWMGLRDSDGNKGRKLGYSFVCLNGK
jgi:hypothetical protein